MSIMRHNSSGFTLLEVLVALFIFTILSMMMVASLRTVIDAEMRTEEKAKRLRDLQFVFLSLSRDVEQVVARNVVNGANKEEVAFLGNPDSFNCTHMGFANVSATSVIGDLQRVRYAWHKNRLTRYTWPVLDPGPQTKAHKRDLLQVNAVHFQYLDAAGRFHDYWPVADKQNEILPRAVYVSLTFSPGGEISQLYAIAAQNNTTNAVPTQS